MCKASESEHSEIIKRVDKWKVEPNDRNQWKFKLARWNWLAPRDRGGDGDTVVQRARWHCSKELTELTSFLAGSQSNDQRGITTLKLLREVWLFHKSSHAQVKATGPQILAENIQHNFPDGACSRYGTFFALAMVLFLLSLWYLHIQLSSLKTETKLSSLIWIIQNLGILTTTNKSGDDGVLRVQSHHCGHPLGWYPILIPILLVCTQS